MARYTLQSKEITVPALGMLSMYFGCSMLYTGKIVEAMAYARTLVLQKVLAVADPSFVIDTIKTVHRFLKYRSKLGVWVNSWKQHLAPSISENFVHKYFV